MSLGNIVMVKLVKFLVLALCIGSVTCDVTTTGATVDSDVVSIAAEDVDDALDLDVGRYTTLTFEYYNNQYLKGDVEKYNDSCIDEYIKCTVSLAGPRPVCAFNDPYDRHRGYINEMSYCDVYLDNCRRGIRVWRIMDQGFCRFYYNGKKDDVHNTFRRKNNPQLYKFLQKLSRKSGETATTKSILMNRRHESNTEENWIYLEGTPIFDLRKSNHFYVNNLLRYLATDSGNSKILESESTKGNSKILESESTTGRVHWRKMKEQLV